MSARCGFVAIGRNEGERLVRCLRSLAETSAPVVYVDSGSSDGSCERARELGAEVAVLDTAAPFTAARARNFGMAALLARHPGLALVHFIDGDCELEAGWLKQALRFLDAHPEHAGVSGRRRERYPERNAYHRLTEFEWDYGEGDAICCSGDALYRVAALRAVGGFRECMIAGEEPELGFRLRKAGHRLRRLAAPMTVHDIDMQHFQQWWRRESRTGHAYAEIVVLHGRDPERLFVRRMLSVLAWGAALPIAIGLLALSWPAALIAGGVLYGTLAVRLYRERLGAGASTADARVYAGGIVLGKFAQAFGVLRFAWERLVLRKRPSLIEYKGATPR